jgi:hypothetical protein
MKNMNLYCSLLVIVLTSLNVQSQSNNSFSLSFGSIGTQNNIAQPATSLTGQFEIVIPKPEENLNISLAFDFSSYIMDGFRLSSCTDCGNDKYSGFDFGLKIRFEPQKTIVPLNLFTGFTRVITKREFTYYNISPSSNVFGSRNYISNFWDLGVGIKIPIKERIFFSGEALFSYSLESDPNAQQGFEKFEFNLGLGLRF